MFTNPPHLRSGIPRAIFIPGKHSGSAWRFEEQLAADWPYSRGILTDAKKVPTGIEEFWLTWLYRFLSCCPIREQNGMELWKAGSPYSMTNTTYKRLGRERARQKQNRGSKKGLMHQLGVLGKTGSLSRAVFGFPIVLRLLFAIFGNCGIGLCFYGFAESVTTCGTLD